MCHGQEAALPGVSTASFPRCQQQFPNGRSEVARAKQRRTVRFAVAPFCWLLLDGFLRQVGELIPAIKVNPCANQSARVSNHVECINVLWSWKRLIHVMASIVERPIVRQIWQGHADQITCYREE